MEKWRRSCNAIVSSCFKATCVAARRWLSDKRVWMVWRSEVGWWGGGFRDSAGM